MICDMIAGRRMGEYGKTGAVDGQPGRDLAETIDRDRQLDRAARMRTDRTDVEVTDRNSEPPLHGSGKGTRLLQFGRIEIDMRVEIGDTRA